MNESELLAMLAQETTMSFHIVFLSRTQKSSKWRLLHDDGTIARDAFRAEIHREIQKSVLAAEINIRPIPRWRGSAVSPAAELVEFVFSPNRESCSVYVNRRLLAERRSVFHCLRALRTQMISMEAAAGDLDEPGTIVDRRPVAGNGPHGIRNRGMVPRECRPRST